MSRPDILSLSGPLSALVHSTWYLGQMKSQKKLSSKGDVKDEDIGEMESWEVVASGDIGLPPPGRPNRLTVWRSRYSFMIMQSQPLW